MRFVVVPPLPCPALPCLFLPSFIRVIRAIRGFSLCTKGGENHESDECSEEVFVDEFAERQFKLAGDCARMGLVVEQAGDRPALPFPSPWPARWCGPVRLRERTYTRRWIGL